LFFYEIFKLVTYKENINQKNNKLTKGNNYKKSNRKHLDKVLLTNTFCWEIYQCYEKENKEKPKLEKYNLIKFI